MKKFLYLSVSYIGTLTQYAKCYAAGFVNKTVGPGLFEDVEFVSAEEIGQMMGGN
jgi:hypothetical protein